LCLIRELALFAGVGGGILAGKQLGFRCVCAVEINPYCRAVLAARQNDSALPPFPIWDDVKTFDGRAWHGVVDVVSGGFPCQDISAAGKGAGIEGAKSGLWKHMARIVGEVRPSFVFIENSDMLVNRGLDVVLSDLATLGYDARWKVLSAAEIGAPHIRKRLWILAYSNQAFSSRDWQPSRSTKKPIARSSDVLADSTGVGCDKVVKPTIARAPSETQFHSLDYGCGARGQSWWATEPDVGRMAHGIPSRVDRLAALGNAQVPLVAATAFLDLVNGQ
jgi:DNA (cytosine-5)-methyltransferase 1